MSEHFDERAKVWEKDERHVKANEDFFNLMKKLLNFNDEQYKNIKLLDFGAGTGLLSYHFSPIVKEIVALDASQGMINELKAKLTRTPHINNIRVMEPLLLSKDTLNQVDNDFNLIISALTMHHIENIEEIIHCFSKLLAKDGYIAIIDLAATGNVHKFHEHVDKKKAGVHHDHGFSRQIAEKWMENAGLKVIAFDDSTPIKHGKPPKNEEEKDEVQHNHSHNHAHNHGHGHHMSNDFRVFCIIAQKQ